MEKFHQKSVNKGMDFLQAKSPFLGVTCIPTVAIATKKLNGLCVMTLAHVSFTWAEINTCVDELKANM